MWLLERQIYKLDIILGMESPPWPTGSMRQWRAVEIFWSKFARWIWTCCFETVFQVAKKVLFVDFLWLFWTCGSGVDNLTILNLQIMCFAGVVFRCQLGRGLQVSTVSARQEWNNIVVRCWTQRFWTSTLSWDDTTGFPPPPWQALMTLDDVDGNEGRLVNTVFGCCWWDGCLLSNPIFCLQQRYAQLKLCSLLITGKLRWSVILFAYLEPRTDSFWKIKQISNALFVSSQRLVFHWKKRSWQPSNGSNFRSWELLFPQEMDHKTSKLRCCWRCLMKILKVWMIGWFEEFL